MGKILLPRSNLSSFLASLCGSQRLAYHTLFCGSQGLSCISEPLPLYFINIKHTSTYFIFILKIKPVLVLAGLLFYLSGSRVRPPGRWKGNRSECKACVEARRQALAAANDTLSLLPPGVVVLRPKRSRYPKVLISQKSINRTYVNISLERRFHGRKNA